VYLKRYGAGADTYFGLHGWSGDHRMFAPLARRLPASATLWSADLPGCGQTPPPPVWDIDTVTELIVKDLAATDAEQFTLIGYCSGANLALFAAKHLPHRIKRLILIDTFAFMPLYFRVFLNPFFGRYAYMTTFANPLGRWLTNQSLRGHRADNSDLTNAFSEINHDVTYRYLSLLGSLENIRQFAGFTMPIDLIFGANTFQAVKDSARQWQTIWPQARAHELAGAGHLPVQEATKAFCAIVFPPEEKI
jgi:pimeloyl-ACP methyl ester carboxylesterase